jgi:hypothetical protein
MTSPGPTTASTLAAQLLDDLDRAYPGAARLAVLVQLRDLVEEQVGAEVRTMTKRHATWTDVGQVLGVSKQAAWKRYR